MAQNRASGNFRHHEFGWINSNTYHLKRDADLEDATSQWEYGVNLMIRKGTRIDPSELYIISNFQQITGMLIGNRTMVFVSGMEQAC
jgi:hypothetical protein